MLNQQYDGMSHSTLNAQNEERTENKLLKRKLQNEAVLIKNHFIIQICINFFIDASYIFAISYYKWYELVSGEEPVWLNFIYIKYPDQSIFWEQWSDQSKKYCKDESEEYHRKLHLVAQKPVLQSDQNSSSIYDNIGRQISQFRNQHKYSLGEQIDSYDECIASFQTLKYIGIFCFVFIIIGFLSNLIQCFILYKMRKQKTDLNFSYGKFYQSMLIGNIFSFCVPIFLYFWVAVFQPSLHFSLNNFGVCYFICMICILIYFISLIYFRCVKKSLLNKYKQQQLLDDIDDLGYNNNNGQQQQNKKIKFNYVSSDSNDKI